MNGEIISRSAGHLGIYLPVGSLRLCRVRLSRVLWADKPVILIADRSLLERGPDEKMVIPSTACAVLVGIFVQADSGLEHGRCCRFSVAERVMQPKGLPSAPCGGETCEVRTQGVHRLLNLHVSVADQK